MSAYLPTILPPPEMSERNPDTSVPVYQYDYGDHLPYWTSGVNAESALNYSAFWCATTLMANAMAVPPIRVLVQDNRETGGWTWAYDHPTNWMTFKACNPWMTPSIWQQTSSIHLTMSGNSVDRIERNWRGQAVGLEKILPINTRFAVNRETRNPVYVLKHGPVSDSSEMLYENGYTNDQWEHYTHEEVLHVKAASTDGRIGRSILRQARNSIQLGLTMDHFTNRVFAKGRPAGFITKPGRLGDTDRDLIRAEWKEMQEGVMNAFNIGILHGGMDWKQIGYTADDAQLMQNRSWGVNEFSRWFHIPSYMLGDMTDTSKTSIEQLMLYFIEYSLQPWVTNWEQEMNLKLFTPREQFKYKVYFDLDAFLRADSLTRKKNEEMDIRNGVRPLDEVRAQYNLSPYPNGIGAEPLIIASQLDYLKNVFNGTSKLQGTAPAPAKTKESA